MNFYSVLGDSDDEETPKVVAKTATKTDTKDTKKPAQASKPASGNAASTAKANDSKPANKDKAAPKTTGEKDKSNKPKDTRKESSAPEVVADKTAELGAREAGGHGSKQHRENRGRAGRGGKNGDREGNSNRREYDRRSGEDANTKRAPKQGGGAHNWGNENDDARIASKEGRIDGDDLYPSADAGDANEGEEVQAPPAPETFTLDEYLAKRNLARANQDLFGTVKERTVDSDLKGAKVQNPLEDFMVIGGLKENKTNKTKELKTKQVLAVDFINASLEKPQERDDRPDRGSSGGVGGRRQAGGGRSSGGGRSQAKIDISDKSAFPSL